MWYCYVYLLSLGSVYNIMVYECKIETSSAKNSIWLISLITHS